MQTVPLPQLHVFLAVARNRSFSGAARELALQLFLDSERSRINRKAAFT